MTAFGRSQASAGEAGAANAGDAKRIFHEYKIALDRSNLPILGAIKFQDKDETNPLMMADFLAHTRWWREDKGLSLTPDDIVPRESRRLGITVLSYKPGGLAGRKRQLIEEFERRRRNNLPLSGK